MEDHKLTVKEVQDCQFNVWYPIFSSVTFKSKVILLPKEFESYLNEESIFMPISLKENEEDKSHYSAYNFQVLDKDINNTLKEFNGKVFIKLNWKAPKDGSWMVMELKCTNVKEVYQLLKCSDLVRNNLGHDIYEDCVDEVKEVHKLHLVLRRWHNLKEWMEFRCFVCDNKLIGISQRNCIHQYSEIEQKQSIIIDRIKDFYNKSIKDKFLHKSYTFDVYIDIPPRYKVWLIDFNPWRSPLTDSLLFTWEELNSHLWEEVEFRYCREEEYGMRVESDPMSKHKFPIVR